MTIVIIITYRTGRSIMLPEVDKTDLILFPVGIITKHVNNAYLLRVSPTKIYRTPVEVLKWLDIFSYAPSFDVLETYALGMNYSEKHVHTILDGLTKEGLLAPVIINSFENIIAGVGDYIPRFNKPFITEESDIMFEGENTVTFKGEEMSYNILLFTHNILTEYDDEMSFSDRITAELLLMKPETIEKFVLSNNNTVPLMVRFLEDLQQIIRNHIIYFSYSNV
jgi:hypothetical protein